MALLGLAASPLLLLAPAPFQLVSTQTAGADEAFAPGLMAVDRPQQPPAYNISTSVEGWVTAVGAKSITVQKAYPPDTPLKEFAVCDTLAAGGVLASYAFNPSYPLADVRLGDRVYLLLGSPAVGVVYEIYILRRPGGQLGRPSVGPAYKNILVYDYDYAGCGIDRPYHEWINAFQDYEERGIPLPPKFRPTQPRQVPGSVYLLPDGTLTKPGQRPPPVPRPSLWSVVEKKLPGPLPGLVQLGRDWSKRTDPIPPPREVHARP